ncbi:MAG TPA: Holliday junction resolvase [Candidatus Poseidoniales archaeon]|nr:MAG TPA: Holliday junction resolvase [Candidatus Poseidoniales archaeon]HIH81900.1 Holliday junction resolvase [Candidatus Thalassarchaeaceae archaeon]|tara:strand:+ start:468 stop:1106 length:639 start_codon:yes stop_codon:yes gene_type:complete
MASSYERELRAVLAGSPDGVRAVTRSCTELERARAMQVVQRPFLVVRAAGSGMDGSGDLLALRGDMCFPIEVKTRAEKKVYLSGQKEEQLQSMKEIGEKCQLMPLYAHRLKGVRGDSWRIFRVETSTLKGRLATLARRIPTLPLTRTGKPHLDWDQGLPLHLFLGIVCRNSEDTGLSKLVEDALAIETRPESTIEVEIEPKPVPAWMERFHS